MTWREAMMLGYDWGVVCLVAAAALNLQRRGARAGWLLALGPVVVGQIAGALGRLGVPFTPTVGWVWLAQTAANVALLYGLWLAGGRWLGGAEEAADTAVLELTQVRALASRPGRR